MDNVCGMSPNSPAWGHPSSEVGVGVEAEQAGRPFLLYTDGDDSQRRFVFEPGSVTASVGRRPPVDLLLDWDDRVSRRHARFERVNAVWEIVDDVPSRNGTFVNEERLSGRRRLNDGDNLRFGTTTVTFHSPQPEPSVGAHSAQTPVPVRLSTTQRRVLVALCRPYQAASGSAQPATDEQIAEELVLSTAAVRTHLSVLCAKLGVEQLPGDERRIRLAERALSAGLISQRDL
jgi:pSer/pThr/pTyr-binding forkhead associated (FHA) protein